MERNKRFSQFAFILMPVQAFTVTGSFRSGGCSGINIKNQSSLFGSIAICVVAGSY